MSDPSLEEPPPLPADALALLAAYRRAEDLPADARGRIWRGVEAAPVRRSAPAKSPTWGWAIGGALLAVAAVLLVVELAGLRGVESAREGEREPQAAPHLATSEVETGEASPAPTRDRDAVRTPAPPPASATATKPATEARPDEHTLDPPTRAPSRRPRVRTDEADPQPDPDPPRRASTLAEEQELIRRAWKALASGDAGDALAIANDHADRFSDGVLAPEREAVRAAARCRRDPGSGSAIADAFLAAWPRSPLGQRVREACGMTEKAP